MKLCLSFRWLASDPHPPPVPRYASQKNFFGIHFRSIALDLKATPTDLSHPQPPGVRVLLPQAAFSLLPSFLSTGGATTTTAPSVYNVRRD